MKLVKLENLETRLASNNRNECERFRNKQHRIENKVTQDSIKT